MIEYCFVFLFDDFSPYLYLLQSLPHTGASTLVTWSLKVVLARLIFPTHSRSLVRLGRERIPKDSDVMERRTKII